MQHASTTNGSTATAEEPMATVFQATRAEVTVDAPAEAVWPLLPGTLPWAERIAPGEFLLTRVSGEEDQVNEVFLVDETNAKDQSTFYQRTIRVVPSRQRVLRLDATDRSFCAFIDHSLYESEGRTKVVYNSYIEWRRQPTESVHALCSDESSNEFTEYVVRALEAFKAGVENNA
jgi:hypothetical protein